MAATKSGGVAEIGTAPTQFSYAQAAMKKPQIKAAVPQPKPTVSDTADAQKESVPENSTVDWAEEAEASSGDAKHDSITSITNAEIAPTTRDQVSPSQTPSESQMTAVSTVSTPEFGTSSTSTLAEKEDVASIPNAPSETTWESKSQTSNTAEKATSQKEPSIKGDESVQETPLKEAPPPPVNVWAQRAKDQQAVKAAFQPNLSSSRTSVPAVSESSAKSKPPSLQDSNKADARRKARSASAGKGSDISEQEIGLRSAVDKPSKSRDEARVAHNRRASKAENEAERNSSRKFSPRSKPTGRDEEKGVVQPPAVNDESSWPAMGTNVAEERRKQQEKNDKERTPDSNSKPHGKQRWNPIEVPTNYIFETQMPNTNPRRGGRGGARGGRENGGRGAAHLPNGNAKVDGSAGNDRNHPNGEIQENRSKRSSVQGVNRPTESDHTTSKAFASKEGSTTHASNASTVPVPDTPKSGAQSSSLVESSGASETTETAAFPITATNSQGISSRKQPPRSGRQDNDAQRESVTSGKKDSPRMAGAAQSKGKYRISQKPQKSSKGFVALLEQNGVSSDATHVSRQCNAYSNQDTRERRSTMTSEPAPNSRNEKNDRRDDLPTRPSWKEPNHETYPSRGGGRGRGRGGRHGRGGYSHQHPAGSHHFQPGPNGANFGFPNSPTFYPGFGSPQPSRGHRNPRAYSVAGVDYVRVPGNYMGNTGPQLYPLQTYNNDPALYDHSMMQTMSAMPWQPGMEVWAPHKQLIQRLEYWFSLENMLKDMYLRKNMDSQGYLDFELIRNFRTIKDADRETIKLACYESEEIEFKVTHDGTYKLRKKIGWEDWVMPMSERVESAQNDGPEHLETPPRPRPRVEPYMFPQQPMSPGTMPGNQGPYDPSNPYAGLPGMIPSFSPMSAAAEFTPREPYNPVEAQQPAKPAIDIANGASGPQEPNGFYGHAYTGYQEPDSFPDHRIPGLSVISRPQDRNNGKVPVYGQDSRTFSNGSIDNGAIPADDQGGNERQNALQVNGDMSDHGEDGNAQPARDSSSSSSNLERSTSPATVEVYWVKDSTTPTPFDRLPPLAQTETYLHLFDSSMRDRILDNAEPCPKKNMTVLYQFWSHFLIRNFNTSMYNEFRKYAFQDVNERESSTGINNLIEFYGKSLSSQQPIRARVARHYADLVKREDRESNRPAYYQLREQWRDDALNMQNRSKISEYIDADLRAELEG
ncbi:MAG: hypothetical protein M1820_002340 [Bogoriella megaspora]|nr:MAG: hypothetical protein M1820_002340 [Bogoriella megaspora]